jgi:hypothetical protein
VNKIPFDKFFEFLRRNEVCAAGVDCPPVGGSPSAGFLHLQRNRGRGARGAMPQTLKTTNQM